MTEAGGEVQGMQIHLSNNEVRLLATASAFNGISRSIRKCKVGTVMRWPLEKQSCSCTAFEIRCTSGAAAVGTDEQGWFIAYPENLRRTLSVLFSMPRETRPGSLFFLSAAQTDSLRPLLGDSLVMVLQVVDS